MSRSLGVRREMDDGGAQRFQARLDGQHDASASLPKVGGAKKWLQRLAVAGHTIHARLGVPAKYTWHVEQAMTPLQAHSIYSSKQLFSLSLRSFDPCLQEIRALPAAILGNVLT